MRSYFWVGVLLAALALLQVTCSIALLVWAGPLADDPATRAVTIERYSLHLKQLEEREPDVFHRAPAPHLLVRELHARQREGEQRAMLAALLLVLSAMVSAYGSWLLVRQGRRVAPNQSSP